MKKSIYILHYLVVILLAYLYNGSLPAPGHARSKAANHYIAPANGIRGIDNANDKARTIIFRKKAADKHIAFRNSIKPKIKLRFQGSNYKFDLAECRPETFIWLFDEVPDHSSYISFSGLEFPNAHSLRGPPACPYNLLPVRYPNEV